MLRSILSLLLCLISALLSAQNGTIKGVVADSKSGETVIGANVVIQGTTVGTQTDIDGKFSLPNVKPGTYNLSVTYITYKTHTIPEVLVESGKITQVQVQMQEDVSELQEVVITGTREINNDLALIKAIKESKLVVSGISAQQISMSQDRDAAQVVRRVPGITLQDNRFVVVRGLSSRYSNVMLNGILAPSTETDIRAFSFDIIPSGLIDRMLIYKSGSAELPGDFAGSVIQVDTRSAVDENFTNVTIGLGYRTNTTFSARTSQERAGTEFLGFDNGFRDLPAGAPANYADLGFNVQKIEAESKKFANTWGLDQINIIPDLRFNVDLGRKIRIGRNLISSINSLNYSNTYQFNQIEFNRNWVWFDDGNGDREDTDLFRYKDEQLTNNVRLGALSNWSFSYNDRNKIAFKNLYNRIGSTQTTIREGENYSRQQYYKNYSLRYIERTIYSGQFEGDHELTSGRSKLMWTVGYTSAARNEPDWKRAVTARSLNETEDNPFHVEVQQNATATNAARFFQQLDENNITSRVDFKHKFGNASDNKDQFELKAGYWAEYKDRTFKARQIGHTARDGFDPRIASLPITEIFNPGNVSYTSGHTIAENTKDSDSYEASNLLAAGYASINMPLSPRFRAIAGLRVEHNIQKLNTLSGSVAIENPITSFLPSVNTSYDISDIALIRLAYSKTVNRPEFRELAPFEFYDFSNDVNVVGNPHLKNSDIHNVDLRWEMYPTPAEQISAGIFYKYFNMPIETNIQTGDAPIFIFNNADHAISYGAELEVRKALAYTSSSKILNNTSVVLNGAYIISEIDLVNDGTLQEKENRPMQGQSPYVINAGLFYNDEDKGLQLNIQYNIFGKRIAFVGDLNNPTWWEMPRHALDLTVTKQISKNADLRFGISDLLNARTYIVEDANLDSDVTNRETNELIRGTRNGQYFTFGASFRF